MVETKTAAAAPKTPQPDSAAPASQPKKGKRYRMSKDGDYCIMEVVGPGGPMPVNSYLQIPDAPNFIDKREALKFIENAGDLLGGKAIAVIRLYGIAKLEATTTTVVVAHWKPMIQVAGPETEDAS